MSIWKPHDGPQTEFCSRWEFEVLYGGQAGPGKTDCLIMEATRYVDNPRYKGMLFRRTFPQLQEILDRCRKYYTEMGAEYRAGEHRWYFPSGATIGLGHIQNDGDEYNYQGKELQYVGFDEATQFIPKQYLYLFSRTRSTDPSVPPRVRAASNPGGVGHQFFKDRFRIAQLPHGRQTIYDDVTRLSRVFIPGKLTDNPTLLLNDPEYIHRLMMLPEIERLRLMEGVWDAFEGQVFVELNADIHGCKPFDVPTEWPRYRSFDWGYSAPFSVGWWACDYDGNIYRYRSWYGAKKDENRGMWTGLRMSAAEIAREIRRIEREANEKVNVGPADPSIWSPRRKKDGSIGVSVAEEMNREGVIWIPADNDRINGKHQVHNRLTLQEDGRPTMYIFDNDDHFWRTFPLLCEDPKKPEDLDTKQEDHVYDEIRYFCMFRPMRAHIQPISDAGSFRAERRKYIKAKHYASRHGVGMETAYQRVR